MTDAELRERIRDLPLPETIVYSKHPNLKLKDLVDRSLEEHIMQLLRLVRHEEVDRYTDFLTDKVGLYHYLEYHHKRHKELDES